MPTFLVHSLSCQAATLTASQLNAMLRDPSLKISATSTVVMGSGPAVTVLAEEDAKNSDQDLKIDALFLSKALMEAAPGQIETVKVLFSQSGRDGRSITVGNREIQDFGKGKISPDRMLASLRLLDVEPERAPDVQPGAQFEQRLLVWNRIKKLRQQGTGVAPFENIFREVEAAVKAGDTAKVSDRVNFLASKLTEQEEQVKQAKKSALGHGVPAAASAQHASTPAVATAAAPAAQGNNGYIPPDADHIKRIYMQDSENWIRSVESKNRSRGDKLRLLKQEIEAKFASNQNSAAFELIGQMMSVIKQDLGFDPFKPEEGGPSGQPGGRNGPGGPGGQGQRGFQGPGGGEPNAGGPF